jgi:hypothetical protein
MASSPRPPFSASREAITKQASQALESEGDLPPIVARMVIEIRSDGTKTIARGALEDLVAGERIALQADAATPAALARELSKALLSTPILAGTLAKEAMKEMLPKKLRDSALGSAFKRITQKRDKNQDSEK